MNTAFGQYLRAARLGYHLSKALQAWVRVSDGPGGGWIVEITNHVDGSDHGAKLHRAWWEGPDPEKAITTSPTLMAMERLPPARVKHVKRVLWLNDYGLEVGA